MKYTALNSLSCAVKKLLTLWNTKTTQVKISAEKFVTAKAFRSHTAEQLSSETTAIDHW